MNASNESKTRLNHSKNYKIISSARAGLSTGLSILLPHLLWLCASLLTKMNKCVKNRLFLGGPKNTVQYCKLH